MSSEEQVLHTQQALVLEGELTIYRVSELKTSIQAHMHGGADVWIDLSQVTEVDTSGLQLLLAAHHAMKQSGKQLYLCNPSEVVQDFANRCQFNHSFGIEFHKEVSK